jgi:hypothetical protein
MWKMPKASDRRMIMKLRGMMEAAALAAMVGIVSCGPGDGEAQVHVSTPAGGTDTTVVTTPPDTVTNTVIEQRTDTVVQPGTVIKRTDTVVKTVPGNTSTPPASSTVSSDEKRLIDRWLQAHSDSLNMYGDPKETAYTGGTPLFNESTGQQMSKYDYIVSKHPDRPWAHENLPVGAQPRR